jgi:catechol 2,3-dioxygenase
MATLPLDVQGVVSTLEPGDAAFELMPVDTTMGHVHLQVADIPTTESFYTDLGLDLQARYGDQASFLSAGGYHHHLGANVWNSRGAAPPPPGSAALRHFTVVLPDEAELDRVAARIPGAARDPDTGGVVARDPASNTLMLELARK